MMGGMSMQKNDLEAKLLRLQRRGDFILMSHDSDWALYVPGEGQAFYDCTLSTVVDVALDNTKPAVAEQRWDVERPDDPVTEGMHGWIDSKG